MDSTRKGIPESWKNPFLQVAVLLLTMLAVSLAALLLQSAGLEVERRFTWTLAIAFILFFAVLNAIMCLTSEKLEKYIAKSVLSFIVLAAGSGLLAWLFSGMGIDEAGSYRWLYIVLTFGYLVFLAVIGMMRMIVEYAQKEEWEKPKKRSRKSS